MDGLMVYVMSANQEIGEKTKRVTTKVCVDFVCTITELQV